MRRATPIGLIKSTCSLSDGRGWVAQPTRLSIRIAFSALHLLLDSHIPSINPLARQWPIVDVFSHAEQQLVAPEKICAGASSVIRLITWPRTFLRFAELKASRSAESSSSTLGFEYPIRGDPSGFRNIGTRPR